MKRSPDAPLPGFFTSLFLVVFGLGALVLRSKLVRRTVIVVIAATLMIMLAMWLS